MTDSYLMAALKAKTNLMLVGKPGHGKTEVIENFAARNNFGYVERHVNSMFPEEVPGWIVPRKTGDVALADFIRPEWYHEIIQAAEECPVEIIKYE